MSGCVLSEQQKFVESNLQLRCLTMPLTEAALKKKSKDEIIALILEYRVKFNPTLANIEYLKSNFKRLESELSISRSINSKLYDRVTGLER